MEITHLLLLLCAGVCCTAVHSRLRQFHLNMTSAEWREALTCCRTNYTDLVTVYNQEEAKQLKLLLTSNDNTSAWIGLSRKEHSLKWSNGDPVNFIPWLPLPSPHTEPMCFSIIKNNTIWYNCTDNKYFMCYKKGVHDSSLRYKLIEQNMTWYEAQTYCRNKYTDLVSIMNDVQKEEVENKGMNSTTPYWIGLLYDDWEWADGGRSAYRDWWHTPSIKYPGAAENGTFLWPFGMTTVPLINRGNVLCSEGNVNIHIIRERMSWEQALDYCKNNHDGLLRIETEDDLKVIQHTLNVSNLTGHVWVGLRQSRLFGFWVWTNGLPVGWSNWEGDWQPEQPLSHHCGAMAMHAM
ncbi:unnamed protein product [Coregonus sp. 'balchen']|nr:unnamed protein product [Coregonus sp. 'balchen']